MRVAIAAAAALLVLAFPAAAAQSYAWVYAGRSVQLDPTSKQPFPAMLKLVPDGRAVDFVSFSERYTCPGGDSFIDRIVLTAMPVRSDGSWSKTKDFAEGVHVAVEGKLTPVGAQVEVTARDDDGCRARTSYELTRGPDSYGGEASNSYPVSVRVSRSRDAISELVLFLQADCRSPRGEKVDYRAPARLAGIPLTKSGGYARTGSYRYRFRGTGAFITVAWSIKGAVGPRAASGVLSFSVSARFPDGGTLIERCRGSVTWRATTA